MEDFRRKTVLITGASTGLGAGIAVHLATRGARLSLTGRDQTKLKGVVYHCIEVGLKEADILTSAGDLTNEEFRKQLVKNTVDTFGQLDVLVNNAGMMSAAEPLSQSSLSCLSDTFDINVVAAVHMAKLAVPHLLQTKGNIVNISSVLGLRPIPGLGEYCMSKAALNMFTKVLALELAPKGVRVNSVNPGCCDTELQRNAGFTKEQYQAFIEFQVTKHPVGRVGEPRDVARAVAFLASDKSSFITGELLHVDGGTRYS